MDSEAAAVGWAEAVRAGDSEEAVDSEEREVGMGGRRRIRGRCRRIPGHAYPARQGIEGAHTLVVVSVLGMRRRVVDAVKVKVDLVIVSER